MRLILAALLAGATACKSPAPPCSQIVDHILEITKQQLTGHGSLELGNRKLMIDQCEQRAYPRQVKACLVAARNLADLAACQKPEPAPPRAPDEPVPGSGSPR
ncbi:MAG: hypothetical protein JWO36_6390 [Myxococcales bacterium]|nr:hypothetical protein [Myxococcales bacterium]